MQKLINVVLYYNTHNTSITYDNIMGNDNINEVVPGFTFNHGVIYIYNWGSDMRFEHQTYLPEQRLSAGYFKIAMDVGRLVGDWLRR
jgi:hypothetical protein